MVYFNRAEFWHRTGGERVPQRELLACAQCGCFAFSCFEDFAIRRHVSRHRHLADNESELRQLSVDTRCTPAVLGHRADETTNLGINSRSTWIARTGDPSPVSAEPISIPPGDRVGVHDNEPARPRWPRASERNPECSVRVLERWPGALLLQRRNLLPQGQVFNHEVGSAPTHRPDRTGAE